MKHTITIAAGMRIFIALISFLLCTHTAINMAITGMNIDTVKEKAMTVCIASFMPDILNARSDLPMASESYGSKAISNIKVLSNACPENAFAIISAKTASTRYIVTLETLLL